MKFNLHFDWKKEKMRIVSSVKRKQAKLHCPNELCLPWSSAAFCCRGEAAGGIVSFLWDESFTLCFVRAGLGRWGTQWRQSHSPSCLTNDNLDIIWSFATQEHISKNNFNKPLTQWNLSEMLNACTWPEASYLRDFLGIGLGKPTRCESLSREI